MCPPRGLWEKGTGQLSNARTHCRLQGSLPHSCLRGLLVVDEAGRAGGEKLR